MTRRILFAGLALAVASLAGCRAPAPRPAPVDATAAANAPAAATGAASADAQSTAPAPRTPPLGLLSPGAMNLLGAPRNFDRVLALGPGSGLLDDRLGEAPFAAGHAIAWTAPGLQTGTPRTYVALSDKPLCGQLDPSLSRARLPDGAQVLVFGLAQAATATDLLVPAQATVTWGKAKDGVLHHQGTATAGQVRIVSPAVAPSRLHAVFALTLHRRGPQSVDVMGRVQPAPCLPGEAPALGPAPAAPP